MIKAEMGMKVQSYLMVQFGMKMMGTNQVGEVVGFEDGCPVVDWNFEGAEPQIIKPLHKGSSKSLYIFSVEHRQQIAAAGGELMKKKKPYMTVTVYANGVHIIDAERGWIIGNITTEILERYENKQAEKYLKENGFVKKTVVGGYRTEWKRVSGI